MHFAAKRGDVEILEELFAAGASITTPSSFDAQMYPIHWAASDNKLKALKFLLEHRQDVNATDSNGCTPLIIATQYGHIEAAAYLIKHGSDLSARDYNGDTALHWAAYKGFEELVGLLLHFVPVLLDSEDNYGQVYLRACMNMYVHIYMYICLCMCVQFIESMLCDVARHHS